MTALHSEAELLKQIEPYTLLSRERLANLIRLASQLNRAGVPGDFVECGTYKGGSAAAIASALGDRTLWLYDSFKGMPSPAGIDGEDAKRCVGTCVASEAEVTEILTSVGLLPHQYRILAGWFHETFRTELPEQVALLHCDADWYDSVALVLETFYPRVPQGGCVILDDFGYWEGCREAFFDFCFRHDERPLIERVGTTQAYWVKGRLHNRA